VWRIVQVQLVRPRVFELLGISGIAVGVIEALMERRKVILVWEVYQRLM